MGFAIPVAREQARSTKSWTVTVTTSQLAYDILAYLVEHPMAQDTIEGIVEWWLLTQEVEKRTVAVKAALAELVTQGFVLERQGREGRVYYHLNERKTNEIDAWLAERLGQGE
jgi:hypothetical protein